MALQSQRRPARRRALDADLSIGGSGPRCRAPDAESARPLLGRAALGQGCRSRRPFGDRRPATTTGKKQPCRDHPDRANLHAGSSRVPSGATTRATCAAGTQLGSALTREVRTGCAREDHASQRGFRRIEQPGSSKPSPLSWGHRLVSARGRMPPRRTFCQAQAHLPCSRPCHNRLQVGGAIRAGPPRLGVDPVVRGGPLS